MSLPSQTAISIWNPDTAVVVHQKPVKRYEPGAGSLEERMLARMAELKMKPKGSAAAMMGDANEQCDQIAEYCTDWTFVTDLLEEFEWDRAHLQKRVALMRKNGRIEGRGSPHKREVRTIPIKKAEVKLSRHEIIFQALSGEMNSRQIADLTGYHIQTCSQDLRTLARRGRVERWTDPDFPGRWIYRRVSK